MVRESSLILKAIEKEGLQGGEGDKSRVVRHRHIHDPGIQQEPFQIPPDLVVKSQTVDIVEVI